ncbi:MAG: hypothetical protein A4E20_13010 [Nitrospira sp. SG-bin2]|nr:MAG: hypothetical protein A4E20_13010 [Nitrospira sp. SG-bin2]
MKLHAALHAVVLAAHSNNRAVTLSFDEGDQKALVIMRERKTGTGYFSDRTLSTIGIKPATILSALRQ